MTMRGEEYNRVLIGSGSDGGGGVVDNGDICGNGGDANEDVDDILEVVSLSL